MVAVQVSQNSWSREVIDMMIPSRLIKRQVKDINNFDAALPPPDSDFAREVFKDPYLFDYIGTGEARRKCEIEQSLTDPQSDAEFISAKIKERIKPIPDFTLTPFVEDGKTVLSLTVRHGRNTPYHYAFDGIREAYISMGNESVPTPDYMLHELILRGTNRTYDVLATEHIRKDYSFTLMEATYLQRTQTRFDDNDYASFGLVTSDDYLTRAGALLTDQHIVYNSRMFCTRWNGLDKGSIFDDALDDKEYEGNLIYLLQCGRDFVKNNSKVRFAKEAAERIDKPDYAERAVTEALVNSLIHRDYLVPGAEIHIDMYDDRLEISSPGGMYEGPAIQERDIEKIKSERRNPVIADLFHRMRYMERRGSGLKKIINETTKLPGYKKALKPEFYSTGSSFTVILKNVNYVVDGLNVGKDVGLNVRINVGLNRAEQILTLIQENNIITTEEIAVIFGVAERTIDRDLSFLKKQNKIKRIGSKKSGYWEVIQ